MKRVLFDENMPHKLRRAVVAFDVFVTIDQRMRYQQNMARSQIGIVVIELPDTRLVFLRQLLPQIRAAIHSVNPREIVIVKSA